MILKSFSKINLSLNVNQKLKKSGLHEIQTYFCLINLFDKITITKIKGTKDIIKFKGKFAKYIKKRNNSVSDTLNILRKQKVISNYYLVIINKKIPVFAGLGGGTSNATSLIQYFYKGRINKSLLRNFNQTIGSDLQLFLYNKAFLKNLKTVISLKKKFSLYFLLVYPNVISSTKYVYSKVKKYTLKSQFSSKSVTNKSKFINFLKKKNNDLQSIVEKKYPIIKNLTAEIHIKKGCYFSRMTGSGSVCYGVFKSKKTAKDALVQLKLKYPKFWFLVTKTI